MLVIFTATKVQFVWDENSMNDYLNLLNNQINALNLLLTALQCRSVFEQSNLLRSNESRFVFNLVKDDTSSLLWLRDIESCGTYRSVVNENLDLIDMVFDFDREIFSSKVYRMATKSNMMQALLDGKSENGNPITSFPSTVTELNTSVEVDTDETDVQTIRAQPIEISLQVMRRQGLITKESQDTEADFSTDVHRGGQSERVVYAKPPEPLPIHEYLTDHDCYYEGPQHQSSPNNAPQSSQTHPNSQSEIQPTTRAQPHVAQVELLSVCKDLPNTPKETARTRTPPMSLHPAFMAEILQETSDSETDSNDIPILQRNDDSFANKPAKVTGFSFDELVDQLLNQHMSEADSNFSDIFLCLYRKFAAPCELFSAILSRLEQVVKENSMHYLTRTGTQLRVITIVAKWVSSYPGDFASPQTRERLTSFTEQLSAEPVFAAAAQEMWTELQLHVIEDDDTGCARTDADVDSIPNLTENLLTTPSVRSTVKPSNDFTKRTSTSPAPEDPVEKQNRRPSEAVYISSAEGHSVSESSPPVYQTVVDYEIEAKNLVPTSTLPLTKFRYHVCMDTSDDDFADEITRIDWVMFSSIRVRDLVRHVSLPLEQKEKCKSLANVNRMVDHFNHVAMWVSNMILMRDKAKHRAYMLEKFMRIALKLRQLNNYNGLAAVIAGINSSAVRCLAQTRVLVPAECQKRFMRLELLMCTQRSHYAYRLAWENSSLPRIPFIPLHRRDLKSAEEGIPTFVGPTGDRINWKKFEVLAEVILPIMRSQGTLYPNLERHEVAQELILDCRMPTDEEEQYQRSLSLESSSSSTPEGGKKMFPWFQK